METADRMDFEDRGLILWVVSLVLKIRIIMNRYMLSGP